jgi:LPXTG-motif cell wall-anchored protein
MPGDPNEPTVPGDPEYPTLPGDPGEPTQPTDPVDPDTPNPVTPEVPLAPVLDGDLTDATRNGVDVPTSASRGEVVSVSIPGQSGATVRIWLQSDARLLGTFTVDAAGVAVVTIPADASLRTDRVVVQGLDGTLIGWDGVVIAAVAISPGAATQSALPTTGADAALTLGLGILLLAFGGLVVAVRRRPRRR